MCNGGPITTFCLYKSELVKVRPSLGNNYRNLFLTLGTLTKVLRSENLELCRLWVFRLGDNCYGGRYPHRRLRTLFITRGVCRISPKQERGTPSVFPMMPTYLFKELFLLLSVAGRYPYLRSHYTRRLNWFRSASRGADIILQPQLQLPIIV